MARTRISKKRKAAVNPTQEDPPDAHAPENLQMVAASAAPLSTVHKYSPQVRLSQELNPRLVKSYQEYLEADNKYRFLVAQRAQNDPKYLKKMAKIAKKAKVAAKATKADDAPTAPKTNLYRYFMSEQKKEWEKHSQHYVNKDWTDEEKKSRLKGLDKHHKFYDYKYIVGQFQRDLSDEYIINIGKINEDYMASAEFLALPESVISDYKGRIGGNSCPLKIARTAKITKMQKEIQKAEESQDQVLVDDLVKKKDEMELKLFPVPVDDDTAFQVVRKEELENTVTVASPSRASKRNKPTPPDGLPEESNEYPSDEDNEDKPNPLLDDE